jgi:hypothetical protein
MRRQFLVNVTRAGCYYRLLENIGSKANVKSASILQVFKAIALCRWRSRNAALSHCFADLL